MLSVKGVYENGEVKLNEKLDASGEIPVIITFLEDIENVMKGHRYGTKAEFIREAVRDKIKDLEKEAVLLRIEQTYGKGKKKGRNITDAELHRVREMVANQMARKLGVK